MELLPVYLEHIPPLTPFHFYQYLRYHPIVMLRACRATPSSALGIHPIPHHPLIYGFITTWPSLDKTVDSPHQLINLSLNVARIFREFSQAVGDKIRVGVTVKKVYFNHFVEAAARSLQPS